MNSEMPQLLLGPTTSILAFQPFDFQLSNFFSRSD
jgi:hypothetical protein